VPAGRLRVKRSIKSPSMVFEQGWVTHHWRKLILDLQLQGLNPRRPAAAPQRQQLLQAGSPDRFAPGLGWAAAALQFGGMEDRPKRSICSLHSLSDLLEPVAQHGRQVGAAQGREADQRPDRGAQRACATSW